MSLPKEMNTQSKEMNTQSKEMEPIEVSKEVPKESKEVPKESKEAPKEPKKVKKPRTPKKPKTPKKPHKSQSVKKKEPKKTKKEQLVDDIFKPNDKGISEWINREIWDETELNWGKNGAARHGIYFGDKRYNWDVKRGNYSKVIALRTIGFSDSLLYGANRPIRSDIDKHHKEMGCVHCGSFSDLVTDHKNDSYNDPRVLNIHTQTLDDFQCLCNHCNLQKRQVAKKTRETGKRVGATSIRSLAIYEIDFIEGDDTYDPSDINPMKGTYWHDVIAFHKYVSSLKKTKEA